tara:strand:+ start:330 stop:605 length:276 start_codon:yes stop_codon:yes gene_type:complete
MSVNFNQLAPIVATMATAGGLIFQIGKHSEKLNVLGLEVQALEKKDEYSNKLLYDIHGKICKFESKFNDIDDRFKNIDGDLKEIKNCVKCK